MPENVQDPPSAEAPIPQPAVPAPKSGGVYIPEWVWKALQSLLLAAVIGGYGMFYTMKADIAELKLKQENMELRVAKVEAEQEAHDDAEGEIKESLASIKAELPHIKKGIDDLGTLLRGR